MNSITKTRSKLIGLTVASALSLGAAGAAWAANGYKFETADCLTENTVAVRLIDETTGKPITNAEVFAVHRQWLPTKGTPRFIDRKIALTPDGNGRFTYKGNDMRPGATIRLIAKLEGSDISGSANLC